MQAREGSSPDCSRVEACAAADGSWRSDRDPNGPRPFTGSVERSLSREIERDPAEHGAAQNIFCVRFDRKPPYAERHERRDGPIAAIITDSIF